MGSKTFEDNLGLKGELVDQMTLMTLADRYKSYINFFNKSYDPGDEESLWASGTIGKFNTVVRDFGCQPQSWGKDATYLWSNDKGKIIQQETAQGKDIVLFVNSSALKGTVDKSSNQIGTHFIRIKDFKNTGSDYQFKYWDYGKTQWTEKTISQQNFWTATFGIISLKHAGK